MRHSKLKGLVVAVAAGVSTFAVGVSSAWATTTPPGAYLWPGNAAGDTLAVVVAAVVVAVTVAVAAAYGVVTLRTQLVRGKAADVHDLHAAQRPSGDQRKAA